jgi:hypothetical protein
MFNQQAIRTAPLSSLVPVRNLDDLDWLVKESEMLTDAPGRDFVVAGAERLSFRVQIDHAGYRIARVDAHTLSVEPLRATAPELVGHTLGNALACGLLFTATLP